MKNITSGTKIGYAEVTVKKKSDLLYKRSEKSVELLGWICAGNGKPEKIYTKLGINLYGSTKIQTFTTNWSNSGIVHIKIVIHNLP